MNHVPVKRPVTDDVAVIVEIVQHGAGQSRAKGGADCCWVRERKSVPEHDGRDVVDAAKIHLPPR